MDIILVRHADAVDGIPDMERKLSPKGEKQAEKIGKWLRDRLPGDAMVLASPARRTQQTAQYISKNFETAKGIAPGALIQDVLDTAGWSRDSSSTVVIVGHQPTLGRVAAFLLSRYEDEMSIKKGSIWWFRYDEDGVTLLAVIPPELV